MSLEPALRALSTFSVRGDAEVGGGLTVYQDGSEIADLSCDAGSVQQSLGEFIMMIDNAQVSP